MHSRSRKNVLAIIILAQFLCTSIWFATNGILENLISVFGLNIDVIAHLTSSVQFGFISGTLIFAILTIADRFSPSKVFFWSSCFGAISNLMILWETNTMESLMILRFFTGFFLAGIYPVGMKIAADYYFKDLGKSLGYLVGALVLGTALPHLLSSSFRNLDWHYVIYITSACSFLGGLLIFIFVGNGPFRSASQKINLGAFVKIFSNKSFRSAAFGYFGHMWELYTFWAFIPLIIAAFTKTFHFTEVDISLWSFLIIAIGSISCVLGGHLSQVWGSKFIAMCAMGISATCCLLSPVIFLSNSFWILIGFLLIWGMAVIADSPQLSTLVANNAPNTSKGTALTICNCIGFAITILSIQLFNLLIQFWPIEYVILILAIGPILGLISLNNGKNLS